jgi:peptidyl-prolyl cis-trans isomerase SurA
MKTNAMAESRMTLSSSERRKPRWMAAGLLAAALLLPAPVHAQVVVIANGSPITELDIAQRSKLLSEMTHKTLSRQEVIDELINDRIKISKAKSYGFELPDKEIDEAYQGMATRQHLSAAQFDQLLQRSGILPATLKARIRAELTWSQLVRGKFGAALQVSDADISNTMVTGTDAANAEGYIYKLYPVVVLTPDGISEVVLNAKRQEVENLRNRFTSCEQGLPLARSLRDVAVREPVTRSSADLPQQFRELLAKMDVGKLTSPEITQQGIQMFALCEKKVSKSDSPAKTEARQQIFAKKFEAESKRYLDEIRKQAMIEYKESKNK